MRLIQVFVPDDVRQAVTGALDDADIDYRLGDEAGDGGTLAYIPVPTGAVDAVLDICYDAGLAEDTFTVVTAAERATIPNVDALTDQYVDGPEGEASYVEIRRRAEDLRPRRLMYLAFAMFSAVVAVGGLLLDSAVIVVGAMVISPFASSTLTASVGAVLDDREMVVESAISQLLGMAVAFVTAIAAGAFLVMTSFVPDAVVVSRIGQVSAFATPNLLTFAIALSAGAVGALALATDLPVSLAGVAVAAALVPAVTAAGLGVVWGETLLVAGALVLLFMNTVFINLTAYVGLVALGYRTDVHRDLREGLTLSVRTGAYGLFVLLFVLTLVLTSAATFQHLSYEQTVNDEVGMTLDDEAYEDLDLVGVSAEYTDVGVLSESETVTVTVARRTGETYPLLAERLQRQISEATGRTVTVQVQYVSYDRAEPTTPDQSTGKFPTLGRLLDGLLGSVTPHPGR